MDAAGFHELASGRRRGIIASLFRAGLSALTPLYRAGVWWRNRGYDHNSHRICRVDVPVLSIGNLTAGGTGKTPMVAWVCRGLRDRNLRVAILSRGYGAEQGGVNDEALQLEHLLPDVPHLQSPDRVSIAKAAVEELESQFLVLDDGFQHRRLHRDLDWVLVDATLPFGYGRLLPRGLLREPISGLRRADAVVITRADQVEPAELASIENRIRSVQGNVPIAQAVHQATELRVRDGQVMQLSEVAERRVLAFCGIGNPQSFRRTLERANVVVGDWCEFPDHHGYQRSDIKRLERTVQNDPSIDFVLCTHKDLVKIDAARIGGKPLLALCVEMKFLKGEEELIAQLEGVLNRKGKEGDENTNSK